MVVTEEDKDMRIKWYGTASLLLESGSTRLLIDPYLKNLNPSLYRIPMEEARTAQAIFITHPHLDHFGDVGAFTEGTAIPVFVSENGIALAKKNGQDTDGMIPYSVNEEVRIGNFTIRTYKSRHCVFDVATVLRVVFSPRTLLHVIRCLKLCHAALQYKLRDDVYALHIFDGEKSVVVLGSAGLDESVSYPQEADLLVFPHQGRSRMHRYLLKFLDAFRPKKVMADHFDDAFPPLTHRENMERFVPTVKENLPDAEAFVPQEGEWYEV